MKIHRIALLAFTLTFSLALGAAFIDDTPVRDSKNLVKNLPTFKPLTTPLLAPAKLPTSSTPSDGTIGMHEAQQGPLVARKANIRKKWGVDNDRAEEYWYDDRIHSLGNTGIGGAFHAALAPISTKMIDVFAYDGIDVRSKVRHRKFCSVFWNK